jgi:DNA-binding CsgD family transcriptional regulator
MEDSLLRTGTLTALDALSHLVPVQALPPAEIHAVQACLVVTTSTLSVSVPNGCPVICVDRPATDLQPAHLLDARELSAKVIAFFNHLGQPGPSELTNRELEVLSHAALGFTTAQIAERCFISTETAKTHLSHIYRKLGVSSRASAIFVATTQGLLSA